MDMRGHNSMPYGETLWSDVETILGDDHKKLFHFAKWHIEDYILGTEGMALEIEGAYMRFLMKLYQRGKPLPDDDRFMSICMNLSIRVWRRVKDSLVSIGKIIRKCGCLTNARFEKERLERAEQLKKQADATRERWRKEREKAQTSAKFPESLPEVSPKLSGNESKKPNEINEPSDTELPILNIVVEVDKEDSPPMAPPRGKARKRAAVPQIYPDDFEKFWEVYPRREGKGDAFKAWDQLSMPQRRKAYKAMKDQLAILEARLKDARGNFCPMPATWIRQGRFDDDVPEDRPVTAFQPQPRFKSYYDEEEERRQRFLKALSGS